MLLTEISKIATRDGKYSRASIAANPLLSGFSEEYYIPIELNNKGKLFLPENKMYMFDNEANSFFFIIYNNNPKEKNLEITILTEDEEIKQFKIKRTDLKQNRNHISMISARILPDADMFSAREFLVNFIDNQERKREREIEREREALRIRDREYSAEWVPPSYNSSKTDLPPSFHSQPPNYSINSNNPPPYNSRSNGGKRPRRKTRKENRKSNRKATRRR